MARPRIFHTSLFMLGAISGSGTDESFPVRRIGDHDLTLRYPIASGTFPGIFDGTVRVTMASGVTRSHFVMATGQGLSGYQFTVASQDVDGGNFQSLGTFTASGDAPFVLKLASGAGARRQFLVSASGTVSGLTQADVFELMLADELEFPRSPQIGVRRRIVHQVQRTPIPGAAPFKFRLGSDLQETTYSMIVEDPLVSGVKSFLRTNDGGEPFFFLDDSNPTQSYFAESPDAEFEFDDQAGVNLFTLTIREIAPE